MAQHDTIIPRLRTLLMLHAILIISTAIYPSSGMPQAASVASVTPIYYVPPPPATSVQYASTSSYDFWWPYPSWVESSATAAPTEPPITIDSTSSPVPLFAKPAVNMTNNNATQGASGSPSSTAATTSFNSSANVPSSTTSISYIQITASSSPDSNANAVHNGGGKPFKITYLAPIFAVLGLILGLTLSGMIYSRCVKRRDHFPATFSHDEDENAVHGMEDQSDPFYPFPRSRSLQVELGNENPGRKYNNPSIAHRHGEGSNTLHCDYSAVPGNVDATAIIGSPSRDTALRSLAHTLQQLLPGASPSSALRRINDDRVPLVPTDVPPAPRTRGESAPRKWLSQETGAEKGGLTVGYPGRVHASPAGLSALPDGFQEVSLRDEDNLNGDGEDKEDEELIYGRQSHGSIRRRIAEKLRIGSRRRGRAGGRELDDAAVRRVSGTQLHPSGIEAAHLRGSRARDQIRDEGAYRSVNAVVGAFTPQPAHTSPSTSTPTYEHGPSTVLRALNPDHDSETSSSISPIDGTPALGVPVLDIRQTSSGHMSVLPGLRPKEATVDADGGTMHHTKRTRLIPSSKIRSSKTGPISTPPARYRARGTTSPPQRPDDPLDNRNGRPQREPQSHHPMLDAPQTVLSPPAHPDLFFADPVLGQYIDHSSSKPPASSSTKRPNISERRRLGVPSPSYTPRKFKVHDRPFQEEDEIPSPGAGSQSSADPPTNTSSFIPPARTRAMQGRVDAIVRSSWGARDVQQPEQEPTRPRRSSHDHNGRESPSLTAARRSEIEDERHILLAREQASAFN